MPKEIDMPHCRFSSRFNGFALVVLALAPGPLLAQQDSHSAAGGASGPAMQMHDMMKGAKESMGMKPSGDIDKDFVTMMRHHHQTGVQMAEHEIRNGKDQKAKDLARKILEGQKQEIKEFDRWLQSRGK